MAFPFLVLSAILLRTAQLFTSLIDCCKLLPVSTLTIWCCVQSSAYLFVLTFNCSGKASSKSSMQVLKRMGDITEPCETPAGHVAIDDKVP